MVAHTRQEPLDASFEMPVHHKIYMLYALSESARRIGEVNASE